jgi:hypothetical protein
LSANYFPFQSTAPFDAPKSTTRGKKMSETQPQKDYFWLYIGSLAAVLITVILMVKTSESEKYSKIQQIEDEQKALMNIRVISSD